VRGRADLGIGSLDDLRFQFTIWYEDVTSSARLIHGDELLDRLAVHVAVPDQRGREPEARR
jgi:hypothetical protein